MDDSLLLSDVPSVGWNGYKSRNMFQESQRHENNNPTPLFWNPRNDEIVWSVLKWLNQARKLPITMIF